MTMTREYDLAIDRLVERLERIAPRDSSAFFTLFGQPTTTFLDYLTIAAAGHATADPPTIDGVARRVEGQP
ncbi:MAG: hypothetical protein AB7P02_27310 [Alphaproteobacteria bacterium]